MRSNHSKSKILQDMWNAPPGFRPTKSAPSSPAKPLGISRTHSVGTESFHVTHKVPVGDTPYVRAKNVQVNKSSGSFTKFGSQNLNFSGFEFWVVF